MEARALQISPLMRLISAGTGGEMGGGGVSDSALALQSLVNKKILLENWKTSQIMKMRRCPGLCGGEGGHFWGKKKNIDVKGSRRKSWSGLIDGFKRINNPDFKC